MLMTNLMPVSLRTLPRDAAILFLTRFTRLFAYGALSVVLVFYLVSLGITETQVGLLLTLTLAGDRAISLLLTTRADRIRRRRSRTGCGRTPSLPARRGRPSLLRRRSRPQTGECRARRRARCRAPS